MSPATGALGRALRWCPTAKQVMLLEELYKGGLTNPSAGQIHQIVAHLLQFGKVQGKNVFYWFQNHKARDKQRSRKKLVRQQQHLAGLHMILCSNSPNCFNNNYCKTELALHSGSSSSVSPFSSDEQTLQRTSAAVLGFVSKQHTNARFYGELGMQEYGGWNTNGLELAWPQSKRPASSDARRQSLVTLDLFPVTPKKAVESNKKLSSNYSCHSHTPHLLLNPNLTLGR